MFNSKLRKKSIESLNNAVERYHKIAEDLSDNSQSLYSLRVKGIEVIKIVENHINQLSNTPKEFKSNLKKINIEVESFKHKQDKIHQEEMKAKKAGKGAGAGATLGSLGIAVATMGPTAAMGIATTFGVASTGTAIASLSGAAANSAALAWLGGGALAAGGGGMSAGTALLGLAGPVGWAIAGVALTASGVSGVISSHKNKKAADEAIKERENVEIVIRKFNTMNAEVLSLLDITDSQIEGVKRMNIDVSGKNYSNFSDNEKKKAMILVNSTLTLAQLINKEVKIDD